MIWAIAIMGWSVSAALCVVVWDLDRKILALGVSPSRVFTDEPVVEADAPPILTFGHLHLDDGQVRVVQTTPDGRRARIMFEQGTPGRGETLSLYDGPHLRGQKQGDAA